MTDPTANFPDLPGVPAPHRAVVIDQKAYVWTERVDRLTRTMRKTRDSAAMAVNGVFLFGGVACFLAFGYGALIATPIKEAMSPEYWITPAWPLAAFSAAVFCALFLFYRMTESSREKTAIPAKPYDAENPSVGEAPAGLKQINVARLFDSQAMKAVEEGFGVAERFTHPLVEPLHLFVGSLSTDDVALVFGRLGLRFDSFKESIQRKLSELPKGAEAAFGGTGLDVLLSAFVNAYSHNKKRVGSLEVFEEAYRRDEFLRELLYAQGVDEVRIANVIEWVRINNRLWERYQEFRRAALHKPVGAMNRAMTSVATPLLDQVSEDLTTLAVYGRLPFLVGRERELEEMFRVIEGGGKSVVLVGPSGVGKDAILAGIAERMVEERVPKALYDKRFVSISIPHLVSGASPAVAQERLLMVLDDVARSRNIVIAIPNIEQMTGISSGGQQSVDLSAVLVEYLSRGSTFVVATTTPQAYTSVIENSLLGREFQRVIVDEPSVNESIHILESKIGAIEHQHDVLFSFDALERCVTLSDRYMHDSYLPDKAINIAREVALFVKNGRGPQTLVTGEDVAAIIAEKTRIPVTQVAQEEKDKLLHLEDRLHERVIGQDDAVKSVAAALRRARAELRSESRPIANFLFLGPTGVGKTELAKSVAQVYFGGEENMLRFDMSEYQDKASISRLIGAPGAEQGGLMTEAVRQNPFSIVLLDELEKAHPDILNLFLQVMDDGRLTDSTGRTIDFTNTILIATSNAGSQFIQDEVVKGTPVEQIQTTLLETELKQYYRPEFLNRFDGVIVFKPLSMDDVTQIAYLMINKVSEHLEVKGIHFRPTDEAIAELAAKGYDPKFGARPLRRVIQEQVDDAIANVLLEGKVNRRDTLVLQPGGKIEIEKAPEL